MWKFIIIINKTYKKERYTRSTFLFLLSRFTLTSKKMSTLLENIIAIIDLFHDYSTTDKETDTLSREELKELLEMEERQGSRHEQSGDRARHTGSHQGQQATRWQPDSAHGDSDLSTVDRQGRHHQQSQDSSRHSRTGHGSGNSKHRESSVSQASDSEGQSLDSETQSGSVQERSRSSQRRQRGSSSQSSTRGRQGPRHDQAHDSSRHSGSHEGQAARQGQSSSEFRPVSNRGSSISQDSDSEGLTEDSERRYGSGSGNQQGSARGHAGDSARHSDQNYIFLSLENYMTKC
uniref:S100/CaBP-9k-type calcium binding subdomain domain-containing protein n=1 Tax=Canis lupus familiaris TaxID=9615 RepID=A0A8C0NMC9_CANLF